MIVFIAKTKTPATLDDFRLVALTLLVMKSFKKLIRREVLRKVDKVIDPLQFANKTGRGVYDAVVTLLNVLFCHLDGAKAHARLLFIDFSSAFNTIQLINKLIYQVNLDLNLVGWIFDLLTNRSQCVRVNSCLSND